MIDIATQTLNYYIQNWKIPTKDELEIKDISFKYIKWSVFITLYNSWEIIWSAWNIVDLENDIIYEIIHSTVEAFNDKRFDNKKLNLKDIKIRLDHVKNRVSIWNNKSIKQVNPIKYGIIVIKKDYSKTRVILPNISTKLNSWDDLITYIWKKLDEVYNENDYINYIIETKIFRNF